MHFTIKPPRLSTHDTHTNDQFGYRGKKSHRHLATCSMLVPQLSSVVLKVTCRHVVPGEKDLKCDIKNASHTQKLFPIFDD